MVILASLILAASLGHAQDINNGKNLLLKHTYTSITPPLLKVERENLFRVWPESLQQQQDRQKTFNERYGFQENPESKHKGKKNDLPLGMVRDGKGRWVFSCLGCHGGPVPTFENGKFQSKVMMGAPNISLDLATFIEDRLKLFDLASKNKDLEIKYDFKTSAQLKFYQIYLSKQIATRSRGSITPWPAVGISLKYKDKNLGRGPLGLKLLKALYEIFIKQDPDFAGVDTADLDVPAWWGTAYKTRLYYDAFAPAEPRYAAIGLLATNTNNLLNINESKEGKDVLGFIQSIKAPKYPPELMRNLNQELRQKGQTLFMNNCAGCHGSYSNGKYVYHNEVIDIKGLQTDPARLNFGMTKELRQLIDDSVLGDFSKGSVSEQPSGYVAPPLVGVWASAPYLHNGSVPTLKHFLDGTTPRIWKRVDNDYDFENVGLKITNETSIPENIDANGKRLYFDTSQVGKSSKGHPFFEGLTSEDKEALIEYLKTL